MHIYLNQLTKITVSVYSSHTDNIDIKPRCMLLKEAIEGDYFNTSSNKTIYTVIATQSIIAAYKADAINIYNLRVKFDSQGAYVVAFNSQETS